MILYELDNPIDVSPTPIRSYISFAPRLYCICMYIELYQDKCTHVAIQRADIHYGLESPRNDRLANITTVSQRITE